MSVLIGTFANCELQPTVIYNNETKTKKIIFPEATFPSDDKINKFLEEVYYLSDEHGQLKTFPTQDDAEKYLLDIGITEKQIHYYFIFPEENEEE